MSLNINIEDTSTVGDLLEVFSAIVNKVLQRMKHEFNLKDKNNLDALYKTHVKQRYFPHFLPLYF